MKLAPSVKIVVNYHKVVAILNILRVKCDLTTDDMEETDSDLSE